MKMNNFVGNILQSKFYACCYILLAGMGVGGGTGEGLAPHGFWNFNQKRLFS